MCELLDDAVDLVTKYGDDGGDKVSMMHWARTEDEKGEMNDFATPTGGTALLSLTKHCNAIVHTTASAKQPTKL